MHLRHDTRFETYCGLPLQIDGSMNFIAAVTSSDQKRVSCKDCRAALKRDMNPNLRAEYILKHFGSASKPWGKEYQSG